MADKEIKQVLQKIADSQLIMAEAVKNINHNTSQLAECNTKLTEVMITHNTQNATEHSGFKETLEKYWKLILVMLALIAGMVGIKLVLPNV